MCACVFHCLKHGFPTRTPVRFLNSFYPLDWLSRLYLDDGSSFGYKTGSYIEIEYTFDGLMLSSRVVSSSSTFFAKQTIEKIVILGISNAPKKAHQTSEPEVKLVSVEESVLLSDRLSSIIIFFGLLQFMFPPPSPCLPRAQQETEMGPPQLRADLPSSAVIVKKPGVMIGLAWSISFEW